MNLSKMRWLHHRLSAALLGSLVFPHAWAQQDGRYYHGHMWDGGWLGWIFGPMMMILFVGLIVVAVVLTVRWLGDGGRGEAANPASKTPLDILRERFARGEIDRDEFEERRNVLEK